MPGLLGFGGDSSLILPSQHFSYIHLSAAALLNSKQGFCKGPCISKSTHYLKCIIWCYLLGNFGESISVYVLCTVFVESNMLIIYLKQHSLTHTSSHPTSNPSFNLYFFQASSLQWQLCVISPLPIAGCLQSWCFWSPVFNPNTSLMFPDISDPASKCAEQTAVSVDWFLSGSKRLLRKCQCSLNYTWSDKWSCFVEISVFFFLIFIFSPRQKMPTVVFFSPPLCLGWETRHTHYNVFQDLFVKAALLASIRANWNASLIIFIIECCPQKLQMHLKMVVRVHFER